MANKRLLVFVTVIIALLFAWSQMRKDLNYLFPVGLRDFTSGVGLLKAARAYEKYGFWNIHGRPYIEGTTVVPSYKGLPPLPYWLHYAFSKVFNVSIYDFYTHRLIRIIISLIGLTLVFILGRLLFHNDFIAAIGTLYVATLPSYIMYATSLYLRHPLLFILLPLELIAIVMFIRNSNVRNAFFLFVSSCILGFSSYKYHPFVMFFALGYSVLIKQFSFKKALKLTIPILAGLISAMLLWFYISSLEQGLEASFLKMVERFNKRFATGGIPFKYLKKPMIGYVFRFIKELGIDALMSFVFLIFILLRNKVRLRRLSEHERLLVLLWFCGLSWTIVMFNHAIIHNFYIITYSYYIPAAYTVGWFVRLLVEKIQNGNLKITFLMILFVIFSIDRIQEVFAINRKEIITAEEIKALDSTVKNKARQDIRLFLVVKDGNIRSALNFIVFRTADTLIEAYKLDNLSDLDTIQFEPERDIVIISKCNYYLTPIVYKPNEGGFISKQLRKLIPRSRCYRTSYIDSVLRKNNLCKSFVGENFIFAEKCKP